MRAYRDDDGARTDRANALIDEIAQLERKKVEHAANEQRLEDARRELGTLQISPGAAPPEKPPGFFMHVVVFGMTAGATFLGYTLFF